MHPLLYLLVTDRCVPDEFDSPFSNNGTFVSFNQAFEERQLGKDTIARGKKNHKSVFLKLGLRSERSIYLCELIRKNRLIRLDFLCLPMLRVDYNVDDLGFVFAALLFFFVIGILVFVIQIFPLGLFIVAIDICLFLPRDDEGMSLENRCAFQCNRLR